MWDFEHKEKSGWTGPSSFVLEVPLRYLRPSVIYSVPCDWILQRAYSPFFPPPGAEPGRAKRESRITCTPMLRTPLFFPQIGGKPDLVVLSRSSLWRDFLNNNIQAKISAFRLGKNISINPKSVEYYQCHVKPHSVCFFTTISKITKEIFVRTLLLDGSARS